MSDEDRLYRPNVGIMLLNRENKVFVAQRLDFPGDAWQMPQGGIDEGEDPRAAAFRELEEEIGTGAASYLAESRDWFRYELPQELRGKLWGGKWKGQRQKWFALRFEGADSDIDLATQHPEFSAWKWAAPRDVPRLIIPFKRPIYERIVEEFRPYWEAQA